MSDPKYTYVERPAGAIMGRRGFFKVVGLCAFAIAATSWGIKCLLGGRNNVIRARQAGLYKDDKLCQAMKLTRSHENPVITQIYKDLGASPMDNTVYQFLHTHYYQRTRLSVAGHDGH